MPGCCASSSTKGTDKFFSKNSKRYIKRFRKKGLAKEQRLLLEGITSTSVNGKSILDIGCGVGGLHLSLLQNGAKSALGIDISEGMISHAKQLSKDLDLQQKTAYVHGDFVEKEAGIPPSDIVMMDKVVCCYENLDLLLDTSLSKSNSVFALSFPRNHFLIKFMAHTAISLGKLFHWSFSPYWHDWDGMVQMIRNKGFKECYRNKTFLWEVCVFNRI